MKIVKIPSSLGCLSKNEGCKEAPDKIMESLREQDLIFDIDEVKIDKNNIDNTNRNIFKKEGDIFIGGDHSITYSLFKAFSKKFSNPCLVVFDAHPDCEVYTDTVSHEDFIRKLVDEGVLKKKNLLLVGLRNISKNENGFLRDVKHFKMENLFNNLEFVCDEVMEYIRQFDGVYLSLDIDVLDPSCAPGTGYLEPGGFSTKEFLYILSRLKRLKNIKRIDLVEVNPSKDINNMTIKLGARIIKEFL